MRPSFRFSKVSIVQLSGKDQQLALEWYSRLLVRVFCTIGQNLTQLSGVKGQIFPKSAIFQTYKSIYKSIDRIGTKSSPSCSAFNSERNGHEVHFPGIDSD